MAVSKMQKCLIVTDSATTSQLLLSLQEFQQFQLVDMSSETTLVQEHNNQEVFQIEEQLENVRLAQRVIQDYATKRNSFTRQQMTFNELLERQSEISKRNLVNQVLQLKNEQDSLLKLQETLRQKQSELQLWRKLPVVKDKFKAFAIIIGTIPQTADDRFMQSFANDKTIYIEKLFQNATTMGIAVYCDKDDKAVVMAKLETYHFSVYNYPYTKLPLEELEVVKEKYNQTLERQQNIRHELKTLVNENEDLFYLEELLENQRQRLLAQDLLAQRDVLTGLSGWVEDDNIHHLEQLLKQTLPSKSYAMIIDEAVDDNVVIPTQLKNHPLVEPFELLTEMYSIPKYSEVDPTPYLAPFYAVFFGMMIGDIGYGLLMLLGTGYLLLKNNLTSESRKNVKLFHILAYPSMVWGLLFGSFFSFDIGTGLLSTSQDGVKILYLSVAFGILQLICGLLIQTREQLKQKQVSSAISDGLAWVAMLIGVVLMVFGGTLATVGQYMVVLGAISVILFTMLSAANKLLGIGSGLYKLYGASAYIGDLASYTRLMALAVAGASIGTAFNQIIEMLPPIARFTVGIVLFIVLHGLNIGLAILGAYVHGIRLQFVEFFGKFYEGGGKKFKPLKSYEKYVDIKKRQLEDK